MSKWETLAVVEWMVSDKKFNVRLTSIRIDSDVSVKHRYKITAATQKNSQYKNHYQSMTTKQVKWALVTYPSFSLEIRTSKIQSSAITLSIEDLKVELLPTAVQQDEA